MPEHRRSIFRRLLTLAKRLGLVAAAVLVTLLAVRIWDVERGPPLEPWHSFVPHELSITEMDRGDWQAYLAAEDKAFQSVRTQVTEKLDAEDRTPINRYFSGSRIYPPGFAKDWNRSYEIEPPGAVHGAVVLLHGLTDSPYSLRHIAELYAARGFVAVGVRLPGHGTVPGGLTRGSWQDWMAATRLAMREARRAAGPDGPIHIVGYSNGGALALLYTLDSLDDGALPRPAKVVLLSPMVGVTEFARFAGLAALPAVLPAFAKAAWLNILPEFNPFKYNSFPVNAARQSYLLTQALQEAIARHADDGGLKDFPPVQTFLSVLDTTVSTAAVVNALHAVLAEARSELVLFDINRNADVDSLAMFRPSTLAALADLMPPAPRPFRSIVVTNRNRGTPQMEALVTEAGATSAATVPLPLTYPHDVYSLSHIAVPFPLSDGLYGLTPDETPSEDFGISLGTLSSRGESRALVVGMDFIMRMQSNPFFPYMAERIAADLPPPEVPAPARTAD